MKIGEKGVNYIRKNFVIDMGLLTNILLMFGAFILGIGVGIFYGWCYWGSESKYYKNLFENYSKTSKTGYGIPPLINIKK